MVFHARIARFPSLRLLLYMLLVAFPALGQTPASHYSPTLIVNWDLLSSKERAAVMTALGNSQPYAKWQDYPVQKGDSVYSIVASRYAYSDARFQKTSNAIARLIQKANNLKDDLLILAGQRIKLPPLPARPHDTGASPDFAQYIDATHGNFAVASVNLVAEETANGKLPKTLKDMRIGSTVWLTLSGLEAEKFDASLPIDLRPTLRDKLYLGPAYEQVEVHLASHQIEDSGKLEFLPDLPPSLAAAVAALTPSDVGTYYIIDFFDGIDSQTCPHGPLVRDVAREVLSRYGASALAANIESKDADFYGNKPAAETVMREYVATTFAPGTRDALNTLIDQIMLWTRNPKQPLAQPLFYIQALYHSLAVKRSASIISSSIWINIDAYRWLPPLYRPTSTAIILGAGSDDHIAVEDRSIALKEPFHTYYDLRKTYATMLVGAELSPGVPFGMFSTIGDGVTCIGHGFNWGPAGTCLGKLGGTSFATPQIGAELLIARAFWNRNHVDISALDAVRRLLLASDVNPAYVGQYASAGIPDLRRLLRTAQAFSVSASGDVADVVLQPGSTVTIHGFGTIPFNCDGGACGLQVIADEPYVFLSSDMRWKRVQIDGLNLILVDNGRTIALTSLQAFSNKYKGVVTL